MSWAVCPSPRSLSTKSTVMRSPRIVGFPSQTPGSMRMQSSVSFVSVIGDGDAAHHHEPDAMVLQADPGVASSTRSTRPSAWRANRPSSRPCTGASLGHGQPPNRVRW
jgi:hypothetical protein